MYQQVSIGHAIKLLAYNNKWFSNNYGLGIVLDWIVLLLVLICHERQLNATLSISILKEAYVLLGQYLYFETDNALSSGPRCVRGKEAYYELC